MEPLSDTFQPRNFSVRGHAFKKLRTEKGLTQQDVATVLGVRQSTVCTFETKQNYWGRPPTMKGFQALYDQWLESSNVVKFTTKTDGSSEASRKSDFALEESIKVDNPHLQENRSEIIQLVASRFANGSDDDKIRSILNSMSTPQLLFLFARSKGCEY